MLIPHWKHAFTNTQTKDVRKMAPLPTDHWKLQQPPPAPDELIDCEAMSYALAVTFVGSGTAFAALYLYHLWRSEKVGPGQRFLLTVLLFGSLVFAFFLGMVVELAIRGASIKGKWIICTAVFGGVFILLILTSSFWMIFRTLPPEPGKREATTTQGAGAPVAGASDNGRPVG